MARRLRSNRPEPRRLLAAVGGTLLGEGGIPGLMDLNTQKSRFSLAHIEAVASHAGFQVEEVKVDRDSVDGTLKADSGRRPRIEFQATATAREVVRGGYIHFPLPVKNYNDLRLEAINPRILIVSILPPAVEDWVNQTDEELCLRHCSYWMSLREERTTSNQNTITVRLPLSNTFNREQLIDLMQRTERTGAL